MTETVDLTDPIFHFRYNNRSKLGTEDTERAIFAIKGAENKRLTCRGPHSATNA